MLRVRKLKAIQKKLAEEIKLEDGATLKEGTLIAGFDCAVQGDDLICAAVVLEYPSMKIVERKTLKKQAPIPYLPTLFAFREGPLIMELYYTLENDPSILMVDGHGIAHPDGCGLATYIGVELHKPTIGVAKSLLTGEVNEEHIMIEGSVKGKQIKTKEHAKPLFISPGNLLTVETAATVASQLVVPPHKLPEPVHAAHRLASTERKKQQ